MKGHVSTSSLTFHATDHFTAMYLPRHTRKALVMSIITEIWINFFCIMVIFVSDNLRILQEGVLDDFQPTSKMGPLLGVTDTADSQALKAYYNVDMICSYIAFTLLHFYSDCGGLRDNEHYSLPTNERYSLKINLTQCIQ